MSSSVENLLERLAQLDACAVSDAMDALGLVPAVTGIGRQSGTGTLTGRIKTVLLAEGASPPGAPKIHLGARAIAEGDAQTVIVVSHPGIDAGGWGGVLSSAANHRGIRGVIVDGPTRDVDEARALDFAIFARATTARTARGRVHEVATGCDLTIGDSSVRDGDLVIADGSGVVFIPAARASEVIGKAEDIAKQELAMKQALYGGAAGTQVMGATYETMLENRR